MKPNIGIIGLGVMGAGVAECFLTNGYEVWVYDKDADVLSGAAKKIEREIFMHAFMKKSGNIVQGKISDSIHIMDTLKGCSELDIIIENIQEDISEKRELYLQMNEKCKPECIFMVNTSCISITMIASYMKQPDKVIGTHFMNPVPMIDTVEVIKGFHTSDDTIEAVKEILACINKNAIIVNDSPGFVSNRISHLMMNEAIFLVESNVADARSIDEIFKKCYGHKMGPLETADLIGLDTVLKSLDVLFESFHDPKFRSCPLLRRMVDVGLHGRKSGKGFYDYKNLTR